LSGFLAHHKSLRSDKAECINDDFTFHGLNGVDHYSDGAGSKLLEGLLGVDVDGGEPAAEAWVGVVPAYHCFRSAVCLARII